MGAEVFSFGPAFFADFFPMKMRQRSTTSFLTIFHLTSLSYSTTAG